MKKKEIIFGLHPVEEALKQGTQISKIWVKSPSQHPGHRRILKLAREKSIPCSRVPLVKLQQLTSVQHQGVVALRSPISFASLPTLLQHTYDQGKVPLLVMLSHIEDTRNLGAIIRTTFATQVDALILPLQGCPPIDGHTMKTSAGALAHMPICRVPDLSAAIQYVQESGLQVVACTEKATATHYQIDFTQPTALLLGGEAKGIPLQQLQQADQKARIPMEGTLGSLNLSVATAVVLYEAVRQRHDPS